MLASSGTMSLSGGTLNRSISLEWGYTSTTSINLNQLAGTWWSHIDDSQGP